MASQQSQHHGSLNPAVCTFEFSQDRQQLASVSNNGRIVIDSTTRVLQLEGHSMSLAVRLSFSPNGKQLASVSDDSEVKLWDLETGKCLKNTQFENEVFAIAFLLDGLRIVSGSADRTAKVYGLLTNDRLQFKELISTDINTGWGAAAFSPDGKRLAIAEGTTIRLLDLGTGEQLSELTVHTMVVWSVVFSSDGQWLASGSTDGTVRIWNPLSGKQPLELKGHTMIVLSVVFSSDDQWLASGSTDGTVRIWDPSTGQQLHTLESNSEREPVQGLAFLPDGPDGPWLISSDGTTNKLWKCDDRRRGFKPIQ